jgi:hypothetical protein
MGRMLRPAIALHFVAIGMMAFSPPGSSASGTRSPGVSGTSPTIEVLSTDVVAPEQIAVHKGKVYVGDAARSTLTELGNPTALVTGPQPGEIAGVDFKPADSPVLAYASTDRSTGKGTVTIRRPGSSPLVARGSVYRVKPKTGRAEQVVTGLAGAVNLALAPGGKIYVAELHSGKISLATPGGRRGGRRA